MKPKKKNKSTLMEKSTICMGSDGEIELDIYVQPRSKKYVLWKDARDVVHNLDGRIEELHDLLAECVTY